MMLIASSISCSSSVRQVIHAAAAVARTWRWVALVHHSTGTSFSTPGCCISTPNSLKAQSSPHSAHARLRMLQRAHPFHSPTHDAPPICVHVMAPRCAAWPPLGVASNYLKPSKLTPMNLQHKQVSAYDAGGRTSTQLHTAQYRAVTVFVS